MAYQSVRVAPIPDGDFVGVAIKSVAEGQNHVGLIYRLDDDPARLLHLAWHFDLRDELIREDYFWDAVGFLDSTNTAFMAAFLASVKSAAVAGIPYGFDVSNRYFTLHGEYVPPPDGKGLTCASFVFTVFRDQGFAVLDLKSWPARPSDEEWQRFVMRALDGSATEVHLAELAADLPAVRIRPEEVAACSAVQDIPLGFSVAEQLAAEVLAVINA